jgi:hypothetical protein
MIKNLNDDKDFEEMSYIESSTSPAMDLHLGETRSTQDYGIISVIRPRPNSSNVRDLGLLVLADGRSCNLSVSVIILQYRTKSQLAILTYRKQCNIRGAIRGRIIPDFGTAELDFLLKS